MVFNLRLSVFKIVNNIDIFSQDIMWDSPIIDAIGCIGLVY